MSYIHFNPTRLTNLEFTTRREVIRTNHAGSYISTTINGCNTRKYHGLLVCPVDSLGGTKHVLLSALDETVVVKGASFNLATRRFAGGHIEPKGNKYLTKFEFEKVPCFTFRVGNVVLTKERVLVDKEQQLLVRYKVEEAPGPIVMQFRPFLAFRNIHELSKCNLYAQTHFETVPNGISLKLYDGYPTLNMQFSKEAEFIAAPDWYYNVEYIKEKHRGYPCHEDLYTPGIFEVKLKEGDSIIFSASTTVSHPVGLKQRYKWEVSKRTSRDSFLGCLKSAASQFIVYKDESAVDIIAGFPWYNSISRQTFISLPGLRHAQNERRLKLEILSTYLPYLNRGLLPCSIADKDPVYHSADASLWFIWAMQKFKLRGSRYLDYSHSFYLAVKDILENYRRGTNLVSMLENGLLFAAEPGVALTWMDSYSHGSPAVPRYGEPVELNALWYNAVCFGMEFARVEQDTDFLEDWKGMPERIAESFMETFWNESKGYLADAANSLYTDWSVRPNMVIAAAMHYTPLSRDQKEKILNIIIHQLLTPKGLRSLSPDDPDYIGVVEGTPDQRQMAEHNGAVYPWLIQFFADLYFDIHKKNGVGFIRKLVQGFESEMLDYCLGTVSEMYDGNPPHNAKGAVSQAWNVAAILYTHYLAEEIEGRHSG